MYKKDYKYASVDFITTGLLEENKVNPIFHSSTNLSPKSLAKATAKVVEFILNKTQEYSTPIISREEISYYLGINTTLVGHGIRVAKAAGLIDVTRKGTLKGTSKIALDLSRLTEIERKGRNLLERQAAEFEDYKKEKLEHHKQDIDKYFSIKYGVVSKWSKVPEWPEEKTEAINKMAYGSPRDITTGKDPYKTGLSIFEQLMIQIISKSHLRYNKKPLYWNSSMFNVIECTLIGHSLEDCEEADIEKELSVKCIPQKLIDIVKFIFSDLFKPTTKCDSELFEVKFKYAVDIAFDKAAKVLYENKEDKIYNDKCNYEDIDYYSNAVNLGERTISKRNPFNSLFSNRNPRTLCFHDFLILLPKDYQEKWFKIYEKNSQESLKEKDTNWVFNFR